MIQYILAVGIFLNIWLFLGICQYIRHKLLEIKKLYEIYEKREKEREIEVKGYIKKLNERMNGYEAMDKLQTVNTEWLRKEIQQLRESFEKPKD
jgi:23S rRNA maturation-related 3'-5' exoribonuclease YhaM